MTESVCIIGAGIGGLTAGAFLARRGYKVTVLEKASTVGGSAEWYVRRGRAFPTGATLAFGLEEAGLLRTILDELDIRLAAEELTHPMDVVLPDRTISIYKDRTLWERELRNQFPDRSGDIVRFWNELVRIGDLVFDVSGMRVSLPVRRIYDLGGLPRYAAARPWSAFALARYARWTVEDLMKKYGLDNEAPFRRFLNLQLVDAVQTDVRQAALLPASLALTIYRRGSFSVENGLAQISRSLAERITAWGGRIVTGSPVRSLRFSETERLWYVESAKCSAAFGCVINNAGISFFPEDGPSAGTDMHWGAFRLDGVLKASARQGALAGKRLPFAFQIAPGAETAAMLGDEHGPVYVTIHPSCDSTGRRIEDELIMTASAHTKPADWLDCSKQEYVRKKRLLAGAMLEEIEKVVPVKEHLLTLDAGTPRTYRTFIGKAGVGGSPLTVDNAVVRPKSVRTPYPRMFAAGENVFPGPGTLSAALSGFYAARAMMKEYPPGS